MKKFEGTVEVDETYMGGKRANMSKYKRMMLYHLGRGSAGKFPVVGALHRETNQVIAKVVEHTDQETLHEFINEQTTSDAVVHTDETRIAIDNAILDVMGIPQAEPILGRIRELWSQEPRLRGIHRS
ncbi:MAG: transposase [Flavobacteriaceae bacterium]|nr:transposase [Flavobacteriaceae bacterium]